MPTPRPRHLPGVSTRIVFALTALVAAPPLAAQQTYGPPPSWPPVAPIDSGRLVRMHTDGGIITGRLTARFGISDPSLQYCRYPGPPCTVASDTAAIRSLGSDMVQRIEISYGSRWRDGAIKGGLIGTASGLLLGYALRDLNCDGCGRISSGNIVAASLAAGAMYAAFGALIGSAFPAWDQ